MPPASGRPLLEVRGLTKHYPAGNSLFGRSKEFLRAVDGVDLDIAEGEILALVGESGSGKTTTGRCLLRLEEPTSGRVFFDGQDLLALDRKAMRAMRRNIQIVFQDPYGSLNPRMNVGAIIGEPLVIHRIASGAELAVEIERLLRLVGLDPAAAGKYPHEFSGGQRQRIGIARALATRPKLVVCDEPVSSLDVSVRAQVVNLLDRLRSELGLSYLFIAHDLALVRHIADRVAVMHRGKLVESGPTAEVFENAAHPVTRALLDVTTFPSGE